MSSITLQALSKSYGGTVTVDRLDLDMREAEFLAFLGPSGCGKSTTLRMIAGLAMPDSGRILFGERDVTRLPPYRRNAGLVFQGYALFPNMTVAGNVAFGLQMRRTGKAETEERVRRALELVRMAHLADRLPRQLSGGQQQRVALARAIVYSPDALLLDEPLSALDAKLRAEVRSELRRLQQDLALTTVFVTHDQDEAISVADRIAVMSAGRIEQVGRPEEIYAAPASLFVAEFLGMSNFLPGASDGPGRFRLASGQVLGFGRTGARARGATLAVRPENIRLSRGAPAEAPGDCQAVDAVVEEVLYRGSLVEYRLDLGGTRLTVHRQNGDHDRPEAFARGETVTAAWRARSAILL
ncbi:ABC transporter ATP-binding protein [Poseidonocella sp. HB161398]|uniref:ABC transporter ATP-binding protein n=1 Tax=Poseidonocella sp. HB161398 TaxID=2320855 RepID=UPI001109062C|nr:ABC transporter ATP-binding protein [Poseidonocella sp. HB161398]